MGGPAAGGDYARSHWFTATAGGRDHGGLYSLYGIVNNAGIVTIGPVVGSKMDEFDEVMSVNVYGPWRITRAFAPLVVASKGRIVGRPDNQ